MNFNVDIAIVLIFLALTLIIGMGHGRNVKTIKDYALGGRDFSTGALVATIVATYASGSGFLITMDETYNNGLSYVFAWLGLVVYFCLVSYVLVPRMNEFLDKTSIAEAMGDFYGDKVRVITAIAGTIGSVGSIAVQFKVFGSVASYFVDLPDHILLIAAGLIVTFYSAFGGIRAVTFTDMLQFFTFGVIIPGLGFIIWNHFYNANHTLLEVASNAKFNLNAIFSSDSPQFYSMLLLFIYFSIPTLSPAAFQRIAIGRDVHQVKKAFLISSVVLVFLHFSTAWIPLLLHSINPDLAQGQLLNFIVRNYSFVGLSGAIMVAVIAFAMSTADSRINSSAVLFSNDIYKVFCRNGNKEILVSRLFAFLLGGGAIAFALTETNLFKIVLIANSFYYPIVTPVFLLTVMGFRSNTRSVLIGMGCGFVCTILWKIIPIQFVHVSGKVVGVLLAMSVNVATLLLSHYLLKAPGGWIKVVKIAEEEEPYVVGTRKLQRQRLRLKNTQQGLSAFFGWFVPKYGEVYTNVGIYFIIYTLTTMYATHSALLGEGGEALSIIYPFMLVTGTVISMYHIWPLSVPSHVKESIIKVWWPIALFYMLILFSGFFVLVSDFGLLSTTVAFLNIMIITTLFNWKISIVSLPVGFCMSSLLYQAIYGPYILKFHPGSPELIVLYVIVLSAIATLMFIKPNQEYLTASQIKVETLEDEVEDLDVQVAELKNMTDAYQKEISNLNETVEHYNERAQDQAKEIERLGATAQKILNNVNHELRLPVGNVVNFSQLLCEGLTQYTPEQLQELSDEVYKNSTRLSTMILNMLDLATLDVRKVDLVKNTENFGELVRDRVKICRKMYLQGKPIKFRLVIEPELLIPIDANYMRQVVDNLVINAIQFSESGTIEVDVRMQGSHVVLIMIDEGVGIGKEELYDIFEPFKMGTHNLTKAEGRGVGLALCKAAVEAHGGMIKAESPEDKGAVFSFALPAR